MGVTLRSLTSAGNDEKAALPAIGFSVYQRMALVKVRKQRVQTKKEPPAFATGPQPWKLA
jgi:hypothetical protein